MVSFIISSMHTYVSTDILRNITVEVLNCKTVEKIVKKIIFINCYPIKKVKVSRNRPRWPKVFRVDKGPGFF